MFNQLTATEVVIAMGRAAEAAARGDDELGEFGRGQLLSAYSASRHVAVELSSYDTALRAFARAIGADETLDAGALGEVACELVRERPDVVRAALRELADREVELLAAAIEGDR